MKKIFLLIFITFCGQANSQISNWGWANEGVGTGQDEGLGICTDSLGNVYATGYFTSPTIVFGGFPLTKTGSSDAYVVKYDALGNVIWAKSFGGIIDGAYPDLGYSITVDNDGNVFVVGSFTSHYIYFATDTLTNLSSDGFTHDMFIVKFDASGNQLWARSSGFMAVDDELFSASTDLSGNIYVSGYSNGAIFISKYDALGNIVWVAPVATGRAYGISEIKNGFFYVTGYLSSTYFVKKYDISGNLIWTRTPVGTNSWGKSISADNFGNIYLTGQFGGVSMNIGSITLTNTDPSGTYIDFFLAKYDTAGTILWAKSAGGPTIDRGYSTSTDAFGNVYVTGMFSSGYSITFDSFVLSCPSGCYDPMFIVKYDSIGNVQCATSLKSGGDDQTDVSTDLSGNAYLTGDFMCVTNFVVGSDTLVLYGTENIFTAKYSCSTGVGIEEAIENSEMGVFPNPFSRETTLRFKALEKNATLLIYNQQGEVIKQIKNISGQEFILNRDNIPNGLYFVRLIQNNKISATEKLVIIND